MSQDYVQYTQQVQEDLENEKRKKIAIGILVVFLLVGLILLIIYVIIPMFEPTTSDAENPLIYTQYADYTQLDKKLLKPGDFTFCTVSGVPGNPPGQYQNVPMFVWRSANKQLCSLSFSNQPSFWNATDVNSDINPVTLGTSTQSNITPAIIYDNVNPNVVKYNNNTLVSTYDGFLGVWFRNYNFELCVFNIKDGYRNVDNVSNSSSVGTVYNMKQDPNIKIFDDYIVHNSICSSSDLSKMIDKLQPNQGTVTIINGTYPVFISKDSNGIVTTY